MTPFIQIIPLLIFLYGARLMTLRMRANQVKVQKTLKWLKTRDKKDLE